MQVKVSDETGKCGCGRSPTGKCIGWHALSNEEYLKAKETYAENIEPGLFKQIPGGLRRRLPLAEETEKAKDTIYYQWYLCLRASKNYIECCDLNGKSHPLNKTYKTFGDVSKNWPSWWSSVGRKIFSERQQYPQVRVISQDSALSKLRVDNKNFLILDIPLGLRRQTILEKINEILEEHHSGRDLDVNAQSSAVVQIETTRLQHKTVPLLVKVAAILYKNPEISLYDLADRAEIATHHLGRAKGESLSVREERQRREKAAGDYKKMAINLVKNVEKGIFPSIED